MFVIRPFFKFKNLSKINMTSKHFSITSLILSVLGFADSLYLTIAHYSTPAILACPETKFVNCEKVTSSSYSLIHGIPITFFGMLFFIVLIVLSLPRFWVGVSRFVTNLRLAVVSLGMLSVFYLVYVELYKLNSICLYCTGVHLITFLLFVITMWAGLKPSQRDS